MLLLDLTLDTPAENLALDEALLDAAEAGAGPGEVLRVWEAPRPVVVVGRSSKLAEEVNLAGCAARGVPVLRRSSGGAAVLAGPGCLMYAALLSFAREPGLQFIDRAHAYVLGKLVAALKPLLPGVEHSGTSDLSLAGRKFSGNSLRVKREHLIYHGTLLYGFDLPLIPACLTMPPRQPDYRRQRPHADFLMNLPLTRDVLRQALIGGWQAEEAMSDWPRDRTELLVRERYGRESWHCER